jgi:hypothetical protein
MTVETAELTAQLRQARATTTELQHANTSRRAGAQTYPDRLARRAKRSRTFQDRHSLSLAEAAGSLAGWLPELSLQFHRHMDDRLRLVQEGVYLTCDCIGLDACGIPGAASGNSIELVDVQLADFSGVHGVLPQLPSWSSTRTYEGGPALQTWL